MLDKQVLIDVTIDQLMEGSSALIGKLVLTDTLDQLWYEHNKYCSVVPEDEQDLNTRYRIRIINIDREVI